MKKQAILTKDAEEDLKKIGQDTRRRWGIEKRNSYVTELDSKMQLLARKPDIGRPREEINAGYFSSLANSHIIFYTKHPDGVRILRILDQREDVTRKLHRLPETGVLASTPDDKNEKVKKRQRSRSSGRER